MPTAKVRGIATRINKRNGLGDLFQTGTFDEFIRRWSNGRGDPVPILSSHMMRDAQKVIGVVTKLVASPRQLQFEGEITDGTPAGEEIIHVLSQGYIRAVSIGYRVSTFKVVEKGWDIERAELMELSVVVKGADPGARISSIRYSPDTSAASSGTL